MKAPPRFIELGPDGRVELKGLGGHERHDHLFRPDDIEAVNSAIASGRPLLVRGDPGVGKSELARAAAAALQRAFIQYVVDSQTESRDLLWHFDAVARLGEAQLIGALARRADGRERPGTLKAREADIRIQLEIARFVRPGPLWWAFDWPGAEKQANRHGSSAPPGGGDGLWNNGCVLLIDEIDKAEAEVPNGLLEALGSGEFTPPGGLDTVQAGDSRPLVIITSNNERGLPDAFQRRCLILRMDLPTNEDDLRDRLLRVGEAHFPGAAAQPVLLLAANMLIEDRAKVTSGAKPGQAEFLDLLRAVIVRFPNVDDQIDALNRVREFTLRKYDNA